MIGEYFLVGTVPAFSNYIIYNVYDPVTAWFISWL